MTFSVRLSCHLAIPTLPRPYPFFPKWEVRTSDRNLNVFPEKLRAGFGGAVPQIGFLNAEVSRSHKTPETTRAPLRRKDCQLFPLRCLLLYVFFGSIAAPRLFPAFHTQTVQGPPDDLVPDTRQVSHPATTYEHNGVLLQVVPFPRNIHGCLLPVGKPNPGNLPQSRIRLLGRHGPNLEANPSLLGASIQQR